MAKACGANSVDDLIDQTVPSNIRLKKPLALTPPVNEHNFFEDLKNISERIKFINHTSEWDIILQYFRQ